jgi:CHAT domain-containing protein
MRLMPLVPRKMVAAVRTRKMMQSLVRQFLRYCKRLTYRLGHHVGHHSGQANLLRVAHRRKSIAFLFFSFLTCSLCLLLPTAVHQVQALTVPVAVPNSPLESRPQQHQGQAASAQELLDQAQISYESGQWVQAVETLQLAIQAFAAEGDRLRQAMALSNLSLTYQQLGRWTEAQKAIADSLMLLQEQPSTQDTGLVLAQALNIQGQLQLAIGQSEQALTSWEQATTLFQQTNNLTGTIQTQINQAQALQALGLYRRAIATLTDIGLTLKDQPDSLLKAIALRSLGDALLVAGSLDQARTTLQQSLTVAQNLAQASRSPEAAVPSNADPSNAANDAIASAQLSLGNLTRAEALARLTQANLSDTEAITLLNTPASRALSSTEILVQRRKRETAQTFYQQTAEAIDLYQQAASLSSPAKTRLQAQLNQLNLLIETQRWIEARPLAATIQTQIAALPPSRTSIYNQIDLAQGLVKLSGAADNQSVQTAAQLLALANQQAEQLGDVRAQSYALGNLGGLYEKTQQWNQAQSLTQQALMLSQSTNAADISYRWQWQLGRLLKVQGDREGAISAYGEAVNTLQTLRKDLVAVNRDVQFSFRESVEPVYRELVDLLLTEADLSQDKAAKLIQARDVIEGLQIAELDNFFREACLDTAFQLDRVIDQSQLSAAIFYTIVLPDRLEVILKLPQQPLRFHTAPVAQSEVEASADALLTELKRPLTSQTLQRLSQQFYDWLIRPEATAIEDNQVETLVFVLDGALRSIPMAALFDGEQYLIEKYAVAIAPGLQLPDPKPLENRDLKALVAGLSEARENFPPLSYVETEVEQIQADVPSQVLLNQSFTRDNFQRSLDSDNFSIVHIATHGQFSSNAQDTFILAWDDPINVNELGSLLQTRDITNPEPIELLVLSACRTAVGDRRATLGLAGVAVRAGARSTIASLWSLDDNSGAVLMSQFYQELTQNPVSKAEALRRAQRTLIADANYRDPRFWSPYVLLGNWL